MNPLRAYRKQTSETLADLAPRIGVSPSQLSRIERNGTSSLARAVKIEEVTGIPASELVSISEAANP